MVERHAADWLERVWKRDAVVAALLYVMFWKNWGKSWKTFSQVSRTRGRDIKMCAGRDTKCTPSEKRNVRREKYETCAGRDTKCAPGARYEMCTERDTKCEPGEIRNVHRARYEMWTGRDTKCEPGKTRNVYRARYEMCTGRDTKCAPPTLKSEALPIQTYLYLGIQLLPQTEFIRHHYETTWLMLFKNHCFFSWELQ
jgi:hypothetical protein